MSLSDADVAALRRKSLRRHQMVALALMAAAAVAYWAASRMRWATVAAEDGLSPQRDFVVKGSDWSPWLTPLALVMLAAIAASFAVRGWALRVIAFLVAAGGVLAAFPAISLLVGGADSAYAGKAGDIPDRFQILLVTTNGWVAAVVLVGTACAVGAAVALLRIANGAAMSSKYTTPAARREEAEKQIFADYERRRSAESGDSSADGAQTVEGGDKSAGEKGSGADAPGTNERMMWDALDTGIDPTDPE